MDRSCRPLSSGGGDIVASRRGRASAAACDGCPRERARPRAAGRAAAGDPDRRRRPRGVAGRRRATCAAGTASATGSLRAESGREALDLAARAAPARRPGGAAGRRPAHARDERGRVPRAGDRTSFPAAKRVLLTAYADTEAAIRAINDVDARPLPAQALGPARGEALPGRRRPARRPGSAGAPPSRRASGSSATAGRRDSHDARDFLARNRSRTAGSTSRATPRRASCSPRRAPAPGDCPVARARRTARCSSARPTLELAERLGLRHPRRGRRSTTWSWSAAARPGSAAAVYGASEGLRTVLVEREAPGRPGRAELAHRELPRASRSGLSGADLARRATAQARRFGAEMLSVAGGGRPGGARPGPRRCSSADGSEIGAHASLVATGVSYRQLDAPGRRPS